MGYCKFYEQQSRNIVDRNVIKKNGFMMAKSDFFGKKISGVVADVTEESIRLLFLPGAGDASTYFMMQVSDIVDGKWVIKYTEDFSIIYTNVEAGAEDEME